MDNLPMPGTAFLEQVQSFKHDWFEYYQAISHEATPRLDGNGKLIVQRRPDGYDYIDESHMRNMLDKHFPGWSWEMAAPLHFLGAEWIVAQGHLIVIDEHLLVFNINPPVRKFYGTDSVRIQYRTMPDPADPKHKRISSPHTPENIIDVGDNCKQAVTAALKYAANRLCRIADDVYGKRTEYNGAGDIDSMIEANPNAANFSLWIGSHHALWSEIFTIIGTDDLSTITDWQKAVEQVKGAKGWQ